MNPGADADTIFAFSSGSPPAAIGVIRVSGPGAADALRAIAGRLPDGRHASLASFRDPASGELLDRGLMLWFPGPRTATGEDIAELHIHGGRAVAAAMLAALAGLPGLRAAEPGEFTRRAFTHGVLDLAEAEGLGDLLAAETEAQRRAALAIAGGALSQRVEIWRGELLSLAAQAEALLDFADEGDVALDEAALKNGIDGLAAEIAGLLAVPPAERLRDGLRVVLAGPPNAGKSTLLNALAGREAAITAAEAGTTRDLIEVPVAIGGIAYVLIDSAGLRDAEGIERIGIDRAKAAIGDADILLWLGDAMDCPDHGSTIRLHPRIDVPGRAPIPQNADLGISARTGEGLGELIALLAAEAKALLPRESDLSLNWRQRAMLGQANRALQECAALDDLLLVAEGLRVARGALDRLTGRAGVEEMLDALFSRFCIGK